MKRLVLGLGIVGVCALGGMAACGGSDDSLTSGGATDASTSDATTGGDDGSTSGGDGSTNDGSTGNDGGTGNDGSTVSDGAARGPDGAVVADGGTNADAAGPGGNTTTLACGSTTCNIPGESCCVYQPNNPPPQFAFACVAGVGCPLPDGGQGTVNNTTALKCSSQANCAAGTVCCAEKLTNGRSVSNCQATCTGGDRAQLCDKNATPTGCAANVQCLSANINDWGLPTSFATCGGLGN